MIKLPVHISTNPDTYIITVKDADGIIVADHMTQHHAEEIARLLNSQAINPKPGALDYHVDYLFEIATIYGMSAQERAQKRVKLETSRQAILQRLNSPQVNPFDPGAPAGQHPAVVALANLCGEIEQGTYAGDMYREALKVIADHSTE